MSGDDLASVGATLRSLRDAGVAFDDAWRASLPDERLPNGERSTLRVALDATRESWRRAFDGAPMTTGEQACALLFGARDAAEDRCGELVGARLG